MSALYPNGRCDVCGFGLTREGECFNPDCTRCSCHPDCGPVISHLGSEHAHESDDGVCWHEDEA